jgi:hypothetical protein
MIDDLADAGKKAGKTIDEITPDGLLAVTSC